MYKIFIYESFLSQLRQRALLCLLYFIFTESFVLSFSVVQGTRKVLVMGLFSIKLSQLYIENYFYQNTVLIYICFYIEWE